MVKVYKEFMAKIGRRLKNEEVFEFPTMQSLKILEAVSVSKRDRERDKGLAIISDDGVDAFSRSLKVDPVYFGRSASNRAHL